MKIQCPCGTLVPDTEVTRLYRIGAKDWYDFLDAIDSAILEAAEAGPDAAEAIIMRIRMATPTKTVWHCRACEGYLAFRGDELVYLREASGEGFE